jgi:hypothetical protein
MVVSAAVASFGRHSLHPYSVRAARLLSFFFLLFVFFHDLPYSTLTYTLYMGTCYEVITFPANSWEFERLLKDSPAAGSTEHPNDLQLTGLHRRAGDRSMLGGEVLAQETLLLGDLRSGELGNTNGTLW